MPIVDFPNTPPPSSGDTYVAPNGVEYFFDGVKWIGSGVATGAYHGIPNQEGNANKFLTTTGSDPRWADINSIITNTTVTDSLHANSATYALVSGETYVYTGTIALSQVLDLETITEVLNVLYVSKSGVDTNDGKTLGASFLTINAAVAAASSGTTIFVKSGDYNEINPINVPAYVSIVGDDLRSVTVRPTDFAQDLFYVANGTYLANMTFKDHVAPTAAVAFNPDGSAGAIKHSPYIQNCTSMTTTGTGMRIDGGLVSGLRSMVADAFTQYNQGGFGVHLLNRGYAQLVSVFTICCDIAYLAESGGRCSITNSNSSFGNYAMIADGVSEIMYSGTLDGDASGTSFYITGLSKKPNIGDVVNFGNADYYTILNVVGSAPNCTVITEERATTTFTDQTLVNFYENSVLTASGHTFEWVGSGINIDTSTPESGGTANSDNFAISTNGGKVYYTGTDQRGDFRIGNDLVINNNLGTISGRTFTKSLFKTITPYILALGGV